MPIPFATVVIDKLEMLLLLTEPPYFAKTFALFHFLPFCTEDFNVSLDNGSLVKGF